MKKITVKIGVDMSDDLDKLDDPKNVDKFPDSIIYFKSIRQLASTLSAQKLSLLQYLTQVTGEPVTKVAIELGRKKEAVSRDLHQLEKLGLLQMERQGKKVYPKVSYEAIQIEL
ncbi:MAG: hypothetical protein HY544_01020 [Candidatus Diapherotrites archaeon]|uniref:HTH arsR-type domain-containing protein n=1 Tax=Candidatus Iainarchaeum sp. TaxID=3101447 RepID=A0A8T3YII8_9ARCH|nr:hypothetical protein [Candidatus Diapherotrites archaeon]